MRERMTDEVETEKMPRRYVKRVHLIRLSKGKSIVRLPPFLAHEKAAAGKFPAAAVLGRIVIYLVGISAKRCTRQASSAREAMPFGFRSLLPVPLTIPCSQHHLTELSAQVLILSVSV